MTTNKIFIEYEVQYTLNINSTALGSTFPKPKIREGVGKEAIYVVSEEGVIKQECRLDSLYEQL